MSTGERDRGMVGRAESGSQEERKGVRRCWRKKEGRDGSREKDRDDGSWDVLWFCHVSEQD